MELSQIELNLRPRNHWSAIDLGIVMIRNWWFQLYLAWFTLTLPPVLVFCVLIASFTSVSNTEYVLFGFWWLKPLWERSQLYILSRAVFGELPPLRQTIKVFPGLFLKQIFMSLTIRRLSPYRSFDLPVIQLEQLAGKERRKRLRILHGSSRGIVWTFLTCVHLESFLILSMLGIVVLFIPGQMDFNPISIWQQNQAIISLLIVGFSYLCTSLIAPVYVACGFSSYLNRRTILEGWDIELVYKNLRNTHQNDLKSPGKKQSGTSIAAVGILFFMQLILCHPITATNGYAQEPPPEQRKEFSQAEKRRQSKARIEAVLAGPDFHSYETERTLEFRYDWFDDWDFKMESGSLSWLPDVIRSLVRLFEYLLWAGLLALLVVIVFIYRHDLKTIKQIGIGSYLTKWKNRINTQSGPLPLAKTEFKLIPTNALALWKEGKQREAFGLLYRSTLQILTSRYALEVRDSLTEEECVQLVASHHPQPIARFFASLTSSWQNVAYGHRMLESNVIETLSLQWSQLFFPDESR